MRMIILLIYLQIMYKYTKAVKISYAWRQIIFVCLFFFLMSLALIIGVIPSSVDDIIDG